MTVQEGSKITENSRTYTFPDNQEVTIDKAREIFVSETSGNHRITTKDGKLHIIKSGWLHIEIDSEIGKWEK